MDKKVKKIEKQEGVDRIEFLNDDVSEKNNTTQNQKNNQKATVKTKTVKTIKQNSKAKKQAPKKSTKEKTKIITKSDRQKKIADMKKQRQEKFAAIKKQKAQKQAQMKQQREQRLAAFKEQQEQRKADLQKQRELKEKQKAKNRIALAKMKEEKKNKQEKVQEAKKLAAKRRAEAIRENMQKKKEERIARQNMLKNESKEARIKRIKQEKNEKLRIKEEKRVLADRLQKEKIESEKLKAEERRRQRKENKNGHYAGFMAAVIILGVSVLALGSMLTVVYKNQMSSQNLISSSYEKSFYDLVSYVDNLDVNLSKLQVSNSEAEQQKLLTNVVVQAELAENNVQQLPIEDESKSNTVSFINSIGDYSRSLIAKIAAGETLTNEEKDNLKTLYEVNSKLKSELSDLAANLGTDYKFYSLLKANEGDLILSKFSELENNSVEYPKLIYDGPFSAGLDEIEPKGLAGLEEISKDAGSEKFKEYFTDYKIQKVEYAGETNGKSFSTYNYEATLEGGDTLFAQISKTGGKLIMFNMHTECTTQNFDADKCVEIAGDYLKSIGIENMKAAWINDSTNIACINFVSTSGDIIIYSDMIKVKICEEKGVVLGMEAMAYYLNHTESRDVSTTLTMAQARAKVSDKINILTQRLTVVPKTGGSEVAAYEFMGTYNGATYYVYINAKTGNETEVFKVIESTEGNLLM